MRLSVDEFQTTLSTYSKNHYTHNYKSEFIINSQLKVQCNFT